MRLIPDWERYKEKEVQLSPVFPTFLKKAASKYNPEEEDVYTYRLNGEGQDLGISVRLEDIRPNFAQGSLKITDNALDVAINGTGFFQFRKPNGEIVYTRNGNLTQDIEGNLMSYSGYSIDPPLRIPPMATQITIDPEGRVFAQVEKNGDPTEIGQIVTARFKEPSQLRDVGNNFFMETERSGDPNIGIPGYNQSGHLAQFSRESSNVDVIKQMMEMIMIKNGTRLLAKAGENLGDMTKKGMEVVS